LHTIYFIFFAGIPPYIPVIFIDLTTPELRPIVTSSHISIFSLTDVLVPIYTQLPILQLPEILAPGAVVKKSPMIVS